jgi:hypothetical protein
MSKDSAAQADLNQQTNGLLVLIDRLIAFLCALASFNYSNYKSLNENGDRGNILSRGVAVLISSLACALALGKNAEAVFGYSIYGVLLAVAAYILDWQIMRTSYNGNNKWFSLIGALRVALIIIGGTLAFTSGLISESPNLLKNLFKEQRRQAVLNNPVIGLLDQRIFAYQKKIMDNEEGIQNREALESKRIDSLRLAWNEENGVRGRDEKTGNMVKGGHRCGDACNTYKNNAKAAALQIAALDDQVVKNNELRKKIVELKAEREDLFNKDLSDEHSLGTLYEAFPFADGGVKFKICGIVFMLVFLEIIAMVIAHLEVSKNILDAITYIRSEDRNRLIGGHKARNAAILAEQAKARALYGASRTPVIVRTQCRTTTQ